MARPRAGWRATPKAAAVPGTESQRRTGGRWAWHTAGPPAPSSPPSTGFAKPPSMVCGSEEPSNQPQPPHRYPHPCPSVHPWPRSVPMPGHAGWDSASPGCCAPAALPALPAPRRLGIPRGHKTSRWAPICQHPRLSGSPRPFSLPTTSLPGLGRGSGHSAALPAPPAYPSPAWPAGTSAGVPHLPSALASVSPALRALALLSVPLSCCPQCPPVLLSPALLSICPSAPNPTPDTPQPSFQRPLQPHCPQPRCQYPHPCQPLSPQCPQPLVTASPRGQHPSSLSTLVRTASPPSQCPSQFPHPPKP